MKQSEEECEMFQRIAVTACSDALPPEAFDSRNLF